MAVCPSARCDLASFEGRAGFLPGSTESPEALLFPLDGTIGVLTGFENVDAESAPFAPDALVDVFEEDFSIEEAVPGWAI